MVGSYTHLIQVLHSLKYLLLCHHSDVVAVIPLLCVYVSLKYAQSTYISKFNFSAGICYRNCLPDLACEMGLIFLLLNVDCLPIVILFWLLAVVWVQIQGSNSSVYSRLKVFSCLKQLVLNLYIFYIKIDNFP